MSAEFERLQAAFDRVKDRPEFDPNERAHWLELRQAVEMVLQRHEPDVVTSPVGSRISFSEGFRHSSGFTDENPSAGWRDTLPEGPEQP